MSTSSWKKLQFSYSFFNQSTKAITLLLPWRSFLKVRCTLIRIEIPEHRPFSIVCFSPLIENNGCILKGWSRLLSAIRAQAFQLLFKWVQYTQQLSLVNSVCIAPLVNCSLKRFILSDPFQNAPCSLCTCVTKSDWPWILMWNAFS